MNRVGNRATRQAKYKALTTSYQAAAGRDQQPASSTPRIGQSDCQGTIHVTGRKSVEPWEGQIQ